jgi:hypothetical protein
MQESRHRRSKSVCWSWSWMGRRVTISDEKPWPRPGPRGRATDMTESPAQAKSEATVRSHPAHRCGSIHASIFPEALYTAPTSPRVMRPPALEGR